MKTILALLAAWALSLPAALAASPDTIFGSITDPACGPCLRQVVANGPGIIESKEFAHYLCIAEGGSAVAVCVTQCGSMSPSDDAVAIAAIEAQIYLIAGAIFDYCFDYYPQETCDAAKPLFGSAVDEVCSNVGAGAGGNNNSPSSTGITFTRSTIVTVGSTTTRAAVPTVTSATGTAATGTTARGTAAAGTAASSSTATGSRQTQTPSSATAASVLTRWEILIGLVMLAVSI